MGLSYGDTPKGRVAQAERDYAQGKINKREMDRRVKAEGYTPASGGETKAKYANSRAPKEQPKKKTKKK